MAFEFSASEIINAAVGIEKRGYAFYTVMARTTPNKESRTIYKNLAETEKEHIKTFQDMLAGVKKYEAPDVFAQEYAAYFHALVDSAVFTRDLTSSELATCSGSDVAALELGIRAEKDSIIFYYHMKDVIPKEEHGPVDKIIAEEKIHLQQLTDLKNRFVKV
jgi:rubrerythrin